MKKSKPAANPDAYVAALSGWRRACVDDLRSSIGRAATLDETIKWGNLVYLGNGPVAVIRAEADRVLLSFWRGQRLLDIEPRLRPGGKYEMATLELRERSTVGRDVVRRLASRAAELDVELGDPTRSAASVTAPRTARQTRGALSDNDGTRDVDDYIAAFPPAVRRRLKSVRATIRREAPLAEERISYRIPTFYLNGNLVHFAAFERHVGFYPGASGIAAFRDALAGFKGAKGSVQFPHDEPLPLDLVAEIVRFRVAENSQPKSKRKR